MKKINVSWSWWKVNRDRGFKNLSRMFQIRAAILWLSTMSHNSNYYRKKIKLDDVKMVKPIFTHTGTFLTIRLYLIWNYLEKCNVRHFSQFHPNVAIFPKWKGPGPCFGSKKKTKTKNPGPFPITIHSSYTMSRDVKPSDTEGLEIEPGDVDTEVRHTSSGYFEAFVS